MARALSALTALACRSNTPQYIGRSTVQLAPRVTKLTALDRLGRNLRHLVTLLDELQHLGIGLVSLREALDLTSPIGRAMFALVGVLAEVERAWIVERTHAGLRRARAKGKRLGRPRVITDAGKLRQLLANGASHRAAARTFKVSEGTVRRAVQHDNSAHQPSRGCM